MFRHRILSMVILFGMLISQSVPRAMAAGCDSVQFISDLSIPDGTSVAPGAAFTKTWRLLNNGTCTWGTSYNLVWAGGDAMGPSTVIKLPVSVPPGQMLDLSVNLVAPGTAGHYKSLWKLSNPSGGQFGIGESGNDPFWVDINVINNSAVVYDFVANASYAQWRSGAGILPYPGTSGDSRGYSFQVNNPHLEDDSFAAEPGLLTVPQNKYNGYIQATYPEFQVQAGDKLQTLVNCEFGATSCYVTFRIDYVLPNGVQKTFWSFKEAYDKRFYRANLDLSSLAGQRVRFVFMLLSSGLAGGDRAIWGSPRILRSGTSEPPAPPATLTALPPLTPTATPIAPPPTAGAPGCDRATFVTDVTVQDGTVFAPGAAFTKTWRLKNTGSCTWTTAYKLVYYSGEQMSAPTTVNLPWGATRDQTVDVSVNMVAPSTAGAYRGFWILSNASGKFFGIGVNASDPIWADINVAGDSPTDATSYDFLANACSAEWKSGAGALPCPGTNGDPRGFVIGLNPAKLEDGSARTLGMLTAPQNRYNGYIQGFYPTFTVQPGDHFKANVGCEYGASGCYVTFRLDYMAANGYIGTFWQWKEASDGKSNPADVDLTPLAGRSLRFILTVLATGAATNDRAVWAEPRIVRSTYVPATFTPSPVPAQWLTYTNQPYGFQFMYPPQGQILSQSPTYLKMNLPFTPGTNLGEKYLEMIVAENANPCQSPLTTTHSTSENVVINGIPFLKQTGGDAGVGNIWEWEAYSTSRNNVCVSMDFVLHSTNPDMSATPPPVFNKAAESAVFAQIMSTFAWTTAPITPITPTFTPTATATATTTPIPGSGTIVPAPQIQKLFMQDGANGWAIGNPYVLRTMDGGATWYNVTAPGVSTVQNAFFQDSMKGWVLATVPDNGMSVLFRTTTGGSTWTSYSLPFNGGRIQFLDDMNGFILSGEGSGMNKQAVSLYQTTDGGATWALKYANDPSQPNNTLPFSGHKNGMAFRDTSRGWVGGDIPTPGFAYFYRTDNGGTTWVQQPLPIPAGYESAGVFITAPTFFNLNDAVLPVWMITNAGRDLFLYVTHDGGITWSASTSFARQSSNTDVVSMQDAFTWDPAGFFHATNDAGTTWRQVSPNVNFGDSVRDVDFVTASFGWVVDVGANGDLALYRTVDAGNTWSALFGNSAPQNLPDLAISSVRIELQNPACFNPGDPLGLRLYITNNGQGPAGAFVLRINDAEQTVNGLGAGQTLTVFYPSYTNPVTVMVDATNLVAESDENNNSFTQMVPIPTAPLPCITPTSTPAGTPTQEPTLIGPYAVVNVAPNDVLNIRSSAGSSQPTVGSFPYNAVNVMRTGPTTDADGATWVEVQNPSGGLGWVNSSYLTEYVTHDAFCADSRVPALIDQLKISVQQTNGSAFASFVSPKHGVNVNLWAYAPPNNFNKSTAGTIFTDGTSYNWGGGPSGTPDVGTFSQVIQPKLLEVFNDPGLATYCDNLTNVFPLATPWPYTNIHYYNLYKPATAQQFDFRTWLIGVEYVNGQPYIHSMVSIVWEP